MLRFWDVRRFVVAGLLSAPFAACASFSAEDPVAPPAEAGAVPVTPDATPLPVPAPGNCAIDAAFGQPVVLGGLKGYGVEAVRFGVNRSLVYLSLCPADGTKIGCDMYQGLVTGQDVFGSFAKMEASAPDAYDSYPTVTADARWLFFGSDRTTKDKAKLFRAEAEAGVFRNAVEQATAFAASNEPYLLASGQTFYFAASEGLLPPRWDLYRAEGAVPSFGTPAKLRGVNEELQNEFAPVPSEDELEIFFASSRPPGRDANLEIWHAYRPTTAVDFGAPLHIESDVNGTHNDYPTSMSSDHCELYFIRKDPGVGSGVGVAYVARRPRPDAR